MTARGRAWPFALLALLWAAVLFWESSRANPFPFLPAGLLAQDKLLHAGAYAVLGALVAAALRAGGAAARRAVALAVLVAAVYGATDEWHQAYVPGRDADPLDWAADAAGAIAGAAAAVLALRGRIARASIRA
ncbi:MAG TPA: VanZ family protein [Anaeromyxobacter sp.]